MENLQRKDINKENKFVKNIRSKWSKIQPFLKGTVDVYKFVDVLIKIAKLIKWLFLLL